MHNKFGKENAIAVLFVATGKEFANANAFNSSKTIRISYHIAIARFFNRIFVLTFQKVVLQSYSKVVCGRSLMVKRKLPKL